MPGLYEYTLTINDKASGTLQKLTGTSLETVQKLTSLGEKTKALNGHVHDFGNSIGSLKQKIDILQGERDLIDPQNLPKIQQYNREIASLGRQINNLENTTGGSKIGKNLKDAVSQIPGAGLITNPIVAIGTAVAGISKMGMDWSTGMAKINTTAKLSDQELNKLSTTIRKMGKDAKADLRGIPTAYESIISQTGDAAWSTEILESSLKGAKAGFTSVEITSKAAAQSLSAIGKGKATAQEVFDVLFASKRVGAGEFEDFANNIPGLIASGKNVGVTWKEVSGAYAYMTGKGNDASTSTMLLQNAFTALGKSEITSGLKAAGVSVFDAQGKMRGLLPIMTELSGVMGNMSEKERTDFLEAIGLKDAQAKQAFSVLTDETSKLKEAMDATANATGEMQAALDEANTPMNKIKGIWSDIQYAALGLYSVIEVILNPVLTVLAGLFDGIAWVVESVGAAWIWWTGLLQQGNPWIVGLTTLLMGLAGALAINYLWAQKDAIWTGIVTAAKWVQATATTALTGATWSQVAAQMGLNTALLASPVTWVVIGIAALVAAFIAAWKHSEKFRAAMTGVFEILKGVGSMLFTIVIAPIKNLITGLGAIGSMISKLFKKDFGGAAEEGKNALMAFTGANTAKELIDKGKGLGEKFKTGYQNGLKGFAKDKEEDDFVKDEKTGKWVKKKDEKEDGETLDVKVVPEIDPEKFNFDELMSKIDPGKKTGAKDKTNNKKSDTLSLGVPQDYNQTNLYGAVTNKFGSQMVAMDGSQKPENSERATDKPVINMATRVDEIAGSLRKVAAGLSIPLMLGAGQAAAMKPLDVPDFAKQTVNPALQTVMSDNNEAKTLFNAFDNTLPGGDITNVENKKGNNLFNSVNEIANNYDNSTISNSDVRESNTLLSDNSTVNNSDQGKTIRIDRFTDKIEVHVHGTGQEAGREAADNIMNEVEKALARILNV